MGFGTTVGKPKRITSFPKHEITDFRFVFFFFKFIFILTNLQKPKRIQKKLH